MCFLSNLSQPLNNLCLPRSQIKEVQNEQNKNCKCWFAFHIWHTKIIYKKKKISNINKSNSSSINQSMSTINTLPRPFLFCFVSCLSVLNADCPVAPQVSSACLRRGWWRRRRSRLLLNPPQSCDVTTGRGLTVTGALFLFFRLNSAYCRRLF